MSARPEGTTEDSSEPGWIADTNAADVGKQDALMVHAYWRTLRSQRPLMPADLAAALTVAYVETRLTAEAGDE